MDIIFAEIHKNLYMCNYELYVRPCIYNNLEKQLTITFTLGLGGAYKFTRNCAAFEVEMMKVDNLYTKYKCDSWLGQIKKYMEHKYE